MTPRPEGMNKCPPSPNRQTPVYLLEWLTFIFFGDTPEDGWRDSNPLGSRMYTAKVEWFLESELASYVSEGSS